jgi:hypothetical protein
MRLAIVTAALAALSFPALAQQQLPPGPGRPPPPPRPPQAQPQPPAPPPGMFPCRSQAEVCHVGVVSGPAQVTLVFSNAPQGQAAEGKPVAVQGADLAPHVGKAVMLTGDLGPGGITGAQVVDVAGPLLSFVIKQSAGDDGPQGGPPRGGPPRPGGPPPPRR